MGLFGVTIPPILLIKLLRRGMEPVEALTIVELTVLHDCLDRVGVPNIGQWILIENDQVGELADLEGSQILVEANGLS